MAATSKWFNETADYFLNYTAPFSNRPYSTPGSVEQHMNQNELKPWQYQNEKNKTIEDLKMALSWYTDVTFVHSGVNY